jgi:hypothetical protein
VTFMQGLAVLHRLHYVTTSHVVVVVAEHRREVML